MVPRRLLKLTMVGVLVAGAVFAITLTPTHHARAQVSTNSDSRVQIGFAIAPVPLNMAGRNPAQVGLGAYLVNADGCNDCHDKGPQTQFLPGSNPYFGQQKKLNPAVYLGGGRDFGPLIPGSYDIVSRNITPDKTGMPDGLTFDQFLNIIRTGVDPDNLHPPCTGAPNAGCIPHPFNGNLLQIMPWPGFKEMSDNDLKAIYEYLSAVPCIQGNYPRDEPGRCG